MEPNVRRCIICRKTSHKSNFWRVVRVHPLGNVCLDEGMGRSAYLCPQAECLKSAQKKNRLGKALKAPIPDTLYEDLWQRLLKDSVNGKILC